MSEQSHLEAAHRVAREDFERACVRDYISREDYEAIRARYHETMKAYHDALGYGAVVGGSKQP